MADKIQELLVKEANKIWKEDIVKSELGRRFHEECGEGNVRFESRKDENGREKLYLVIDWKELGSKYDDREDYVKRSEVYKAANYLYSKGELTSRCPFAYTAVALLPKVYDVLEEKEWGEQIKNAEGKYEIGVAHENMHIAAKLAGHTQDGGTLKDHGNDNHGSAPIFSAKKEKQK